MKNFYQLWKEINDGVKFNYDRSQFVKLSWNWLAMQQAKIVNAMYYYAKDNYVNGQPEQLTDDQFSIITLPNLRSIPQNELSSRNLTTGNMPNQSQFVRMLKNPQAWYDDKIDQVYKGIQMIGKRAEDFSGKDIRNQNAQNPAITQSQVLNVGGTNPNNQQSSNA